MREKTEPPEDPNLATLSVKWNKYLKLKFGHESDQILISLRKKIYVARIL